VYPWGVGWLVGKMTNIRQLLALNMKHHRQLLELSQAKLAENIGTATNYISKIESEKQFPSVKMLEKIATALNIDTADLFSIKALQANHTQGPDIPDELKKTIAEKLILIERDLYDNTKKVQELRELLR
jgi:transcriptional regulator with XRE-family HTH domain